MKTTFFAFLILAVILASGIWFDSFTAELCNDYQTALSTITEETASTIVDEIIHDWNRRKAILAAFSHHSLLDEIQNALTRTKAALEAKNASLFAVEFETLQTAITALKDSDTPKLGNIF